MRSLRVVLVLLTVFLYAEAATGSGIRRGEDCLRCLDPYKELGVPPNSDLETCRKAYHNLKRYEYLQEHFPPFLVLSYSWFLWYRCLCLISQHSSSCLSQSCSPDGDSGPVIRDGMYEQLFKIPNIESLTNFQYCTASCSS